MLCLLVVLAVFSSSILAVEDEASSLTFAAILFRHGDRTPTMSYPNDPHDRTNWPEGWGQLTTVGKAQAYHFGEVLRLRYADLLGPLYSPDDLAIWSSDYDRCIMTAQSCLAGLFPPSGRQLWSSELLWQPIPVRSKPLEKDKKIASSKACPKYEVETASVKASLGNELNLANAKLYEYLSTHTGLNITSYLYAALIYDTLTVEESHNLTLPGWTESVYPEILKAIAIDAYYTSSTTKVQQRLKSGILLNEILQNMLAKSNGTETLSQKMHLYSAHDVTIINMWQSLGLKDRPLPRYTSSLIFELHSSENGSRHNVKLFYRSGPTADEPVELEIPGCGQPCLLEDLILLTNSVTITDEAWEEECQSIRRQTIGEEPTTQLHQSVINKKNHLAYLLKHI